jgi:hypothetical protein
MHGPADIASSRRRLVVQCVRPAVGLHLFACLALLGASAPAVAKPKPITGKLDEPGYTVIAVAANGAARSVLTRDGRFTLRPPAERTTLHVRRPDGKYGGPVVVGHDGKRVIVGVMAGARLGRIDVVAKRGYARVTKRQRRTELDSARTAKAKKGIPIGARVFGRIRSSSRGVPGPGRDPDLDGLPGALDIDDNGNLTIDNVDRSRAVRSSQSTIGEFGFELGLHADLPETLNANAAGVTRDQIDALLSTNGQLILGAPRGDSVELDCGGSRNVSPPPPWLGGLSYCTPGGTARVVQFGCCPPRDTWPRFPDDFDPDGDGLGSLDGPGALRGPLSHGATSAQIGTGDVLIARVVRDGVQTDAAATLQYVPVTVPALISYDDGRGNSATISYPVARSAPGTREDPFPVAARGNGEVVAKFTFWRPQRARLATDPAPGAGESNQWTDIGGLLYNAQIGDLGHDCRPRFATESDPNLEIDPGPDAESEDEGGIRDLATDRPANPQNTFTYTMNLTKCLGSEPPVESWNVGESKMATFGGGDGSGGAGNQNVFFKRVG